MVSLLIADCYRRSLPWISSIERVSVDNEQMLLDTHAVKTLLLEVPSLGGQVWLTIPQIAFHRKPSIESHSLQLIATFLCVCRPVLRQAIPSTWPVK